MQKESKEFPSKKDLVYWLIILIVVGSFAFAIVLVDPASSNAKLSLTSTVLSISLAIIAIIFSFVQSSDSSRNSLSLIERFNSVAEGLAIITSQKEIVKNETTEKMKELSLLESEIKAVLNEIKQATDNGQDIASINKRLNEIYKKMNSPSSSLLMGEGYLKAKMAVEVGKISFLSFLRINYRAHEQIKLDNIMMALKAEDITNSEENIRKLIEELEQDGVVSSVTTKNGFIFRLN